MFYFLGPVTLVSRFFEDTQKLILVSEVTHYPPHRILYSEDVSKAGDCAIHHSGLLNSDSMILNSITIS